MSLALEIDDPPAPRLSLGGVLACGGVSQAGALSLTPQPGRAAWRPLGWGSEVRNRNCNYKSFFTHLTPSRKLFLVLSEGEEGAEYEAKGCF